MLDGWSNRKSRSLINFPVNSPEGTFFYKFFDALDSIKNGVYLWQLLDNMVEEVGEKNVLQVVTDNHSSCVNRQEAYGQYEVILLDSLGATLH